MIPKVIHYCWFSGEKMSPFLENCISTWKVKMPEYRLRIWDHNSFDFDSIPFVREAFQKKKWAFVADYIRFYALYSEGGIYLDSDVKILKPFNTEWLEYGFFSAHEIHPGLFKTELLDSSYLPKNNEYIEGFSIQGAIMASEPGHPFVKECLEQYKHLHFIREDGSIENFNEIIIGKILNTVSKKYGYIYKDEQQILKENMLILPSYIFVGNSMFLNNDSFAIHLINGSWTEKTKYEQIVFFIRNNFMWFYPVVNIFNKILRKVKLFYVNNF